MVVFHFQIIFNLALDSFLNVLKVNRDIVITDTRMVN